MKFYSPVETRMYNDQLMMLERAFLDSAGTPLKPLYKYEAHTFLLKTAWAELIELKIDRSQTKIE